MNLLEEEAKLMALGLRWFLLMTSVYESSSLSEMRLMVYSKIFDKGKIFISN